MSTARNSDDELAGLKVSELKKLCKMNNLPTSGTKAELMGRILENKVIDSNFPALLPKEEARLLGDDDDESVGKTGCAQTTTLTTGITGEDDDDTTVVDLISVPSGLNRIEGTNLPGHALTKNTTSIGVDKSLIPVPVGKEKGKMITETVLEDDEDDEGPTVVKLRAVSSASDSDRLAVRANRFGLSNPTPVGDTLIKEKLAARAKRFGLLIEDNSDSLGPTSPSKLSDAERLKRRAERFGINMRDSSGLITMDTKPKAEREALRPQRFNATNQKIANVAIHHSLSTKAGRMSEEERKFARIIKFGLPGASIPIDSFH